MYYLVLLLSGEFLIFCVLTFWGVYWGRKLHKYLQKNYFQFFKDNLEVPLLAGGPDVMIKHYYALKAALGGDMPDELCKTYQKKIKLYFKIAIFCLFVMAVTMVAIVPLSRYLSPE